MESIETVIPIIESALDFKNSEYRRRRTPFVLMWIGTFCLTNVSIISLISVRTKGSPPLRET